MSLNLTPLSDDSPFPIFMIEGETEYILWANQAAQHWLSQSLKHLQGKSIWEATQLNGEAQKMLAKCQETGSPLTLRDYPLPRKGDEEQFCHLTAYPCDGGFGFYVWLRSPQPSEAKIGGNMVSGMGRLIAHELKNPLAGIKGAAQLLHDDVQTEEGRSLLDLISSEIDRIRRLADRMETLGDADPANADRVNIHELLRQARRIIQSANPSLVFTERYDPSLPHVRGDADTLMQALLNLIKNASEAIETNGEKGEIILETRFRSGVSRRDADSAQNLPVEIRIIDNGPGIDEDLRKQIFQPFVTNKPEGQGLGLALVSKVATAHGGIVELSSRPWRTKFSLLLPTPTGDTP